MRDRAHLHEQVRNDYKSQLMKPFRELQLPTDGYCGWHGLLAIRDLQRWESVPRHHTGMAVAARVLEVETKQVKELHAQVCQQALDEVDPVYHEAILNVQVNIEFSPLDFEWITSVLGLCIRCTCDSEAGHMC